MPSNLVTAAATLTLINVGLHVALVYFTTPQWLSITVHSQWLSITALFFMFLGLRFYSVRIFPLILFFVAAIFNIVSAVIVGDFTTKCVPRPWSSVCTISQYAYDMLKCSVALQFLSAGLLLLATFVEKRREQPKVAPYPV